MRKTKEKHGKNGENFTKNKTRQFLKAQTKSEESGLIPTGKKEYL